MSMRDPFGMYSGIALPFEAPGDRPLTLQELINYLRLLRDVALSLTPVSFPGLPHSSYREAVRVWADEFGPRSDGVEYGAIIFRLTLDGFTSYYLMGETYRGFQPNDQWHTVVNGLFMGLARGASASAALSHAALFGPKKRPQIKVIGFAHTHPRSRNREDKRFNADPSEPDWFMRRTGNRFGIDVFPIVQHNANGNIINYNWELPSFLPDNDI